MSENLSFYLEAFNVEACRAPVMIAHGLNQNTNSLKPIIDAFTTFGYSVYLFHTPGHARDPENLNVTGDDVSRAFVESYDRVVAQSGTLPFFLGYSFGGLIGVSHVESCQFKKMALLAPAIRMRYYVNLLPIALPFFARIHSVPMESVSLQNYYRLHQGGVPVSVYSSFFSVFRKFKKIPIESFIRTDAKVWSHPKDELISYGRLSRWVRSNTKWSFAELDNKSGKYSRYNHLCLDEDTLGKEEFAKLVDDLHSYFSEG